MKQINSLSSSAHEAFSQLLPWYVNKTLQGAELKAFEDHLAKCLLCKVDLIQQQKLARAVMAEGSLDTAQRASYVRLKKRLQTSQQAQVQALAHRPAHDQKIAVVSNVAKSRKLQSMNTTILRSGLSLAAVLMLTLLVPRYLDSDLNQNLDFRTLSNAQQDNLIANEIRMVFAEGLDQQQKNSVLQQIDGQFIGDNPTAQGVYTIRLRSDITAQQLLAVVESLKNDHRVIFAEPAYALLSSMHKQR